MGVAQVSSINWLDTAKSGEGRGGGGMYCETKDSLSPEVSYAFCHPISKNVALISIVRPHIGICKHNSNRGMRHVYIENHVYSQSI